MGELLRIDRLVFRLTLPAVILLAPSRAHATQNSFGPEVMLVIAPVGATAIIADAYFTASGIAMAAADSRPGTSHGNWEIGLTAWQPAIGLIAANESEGRASLTWYAASTLPLTLTAHGIWAKNADRSGAELCVLPVVAADLVLGGYDLFHTFRHQGRTYGFLETLTAVPQFAFGVAVAVHADERDRPAVLVASALPLALAIHGIHVWWSKDPPSHQLLPPDGELKPRRSRQDLEWFLVPSLLGSNRPGLELIGRF